MANKEAETMGMLREAICTNDFINIAYSAVDIMKQSQNPFDFVEPILRFMEDFPEADFGQPGPLTHFVETFYGNGYEELLYQSVKRKPTLHTIWMVNRIINDPGTVNTASYVDLLNEVKNRKTVDKGIKDMISYFMENR
ncbi:MAG: hypothetical protein LBL13_02090 [Bacteroidales bacterium]|jgi:hypothetical protein|nr:hypothetical protein [Bacteroidales bacterium]